MNNTPEISVIIPVYNVEDYLEECLNALKQQSFENFEAILINDGSKDNSGKICDKYAENDYRFKVIHKINGGVNTARKLGVEISKGKYITFVDADDILTTNALLNMYTKSEEQNLDICIGGLYTWNQRENKPNLESLKYNITEKYTQIFNAKDLDYFHFYEIEWFMVFWGKLIKKELFKNQYIATNLKYGEDQICVKELLLKAKKISVISDYVYYYRKRPNSATTKRNKCAFDIFESFNLLEKVLTDYGYIDKEYSHLVNWALVSFWFHMKFFTPYLHWWNFISKICNYIRTIDLNKLNEKELSGRNLKLIKRFKTNKHITYKKLYYIHKIMISRG